jgi:hypothetical protein
MTLDRRAHLSICLAGFFVMAGSGLILWSRWSKAAAVPSTPPPPDPVVTAGTGWPAHTPAAAEPAAPAAAAAPAPATSAPAAPAPAAATKRNILFSYRNSKPLKVELVGGFNNWTPAPLTKGQNQTWEISVSLEPGEYAYNFIVDGKVTRDPNNPRTAPEGRSLLVVRPLQ